MNDLLDDLGFIGLGDDGTESYTLALSNLDGSLVATGRRVSGPAPDACARDNGP
jgi:hypothetical protein